MFTVEELFGRAKEIVEAAGRKAGDLTDLAKLKFKLAENEKAIEATLVALGRTLYESHRTGEAMDESIVSELLKQVKELEKAGEELQAAIDNNRGCKTCSQCGTANPEGSAFCNKCGNALE